MSLFLKISPRINNFSSARVEYLFTLILGFMALVGQFLIMAVATRLLGPVEVVFFLVGKRMLAWIEPFATLGMGVAIPKYIAQAKTKEESNQYWAMGLLTIVGASTITTMMLTVFADRFSQLFFGSPDHENLVQILALLLVAIASQIACYSYFRGHSLFYAASLTNFSTLFLYPVLGLYVSPEKVTSSVWQTTSIIMLITFVVIVVFVARPKLLPISSTVNARVFFAFGSQRAVANFTLLAIVSLPVLIVTHTAGVEQGGWVAFAITILNSIAYPFALLDVMLLSHASRLIAQERTNALSQLIGKLFVLSVLAAIGITILCEILTPLLAYYVLHLSNDNAIRVIRLIILGGFPCGVYMGFRGIIDARFKNSKITVYMLVSFFVFVVGLYISYLLGGTIEQTIIAFLAGLYTLGGLVVYDLAKILWIGKL